MSYNREPKTCQNGLMTHVGTPPEPGTLDLDLYFVLELVLDREGNQDLESDLDPGILDLDVDSCHLDLGLHFVPERILGPEGI